MTDKAFSKVKPLELCVDLGNLNLDEVLPPFELDVATRWRRPPPNGLDTIASQRKALQESANDASYEGVDSRFRARAQNSLVHGPALGGGRCGERMQFTVTAVGDNGMVDRSGAPRVAAVVTGLNLLSKTHPEPRPWVEDGGDGSYVVQFVCATPGPYDVVATIDGLPLPMCPIRIEVQPGLPSPFKSELSGEGLRSCDLGGAASFTINAQDEFGNACQDGGARFGVRALGHVQILEVADNEDGTYTVSYAVPTYATKNVSLEVLLDGMPVKGSPVTPRVPVREPEVTLPLPEGEHGRPAPSLVDQQLALRWLKEHPPVEVPDLPPPNTEDDVPDGFNYPSASPTEVSAARLAWRTADEWRRLNQARREMEKARQALMEHHRVLMTVGSAVQSEFHNQQDQQRDLDRKHGELGEIETRLDGVRSDLWKQHLQQQRSILGGAIPPGAEAASGSSPPSSPKFGGRGAWDGAAPGQPEARGARWFSSPQDEMSKIAALQDGVERKKRYLQELEGERSPQRSGLLASPLAAERPPPVQPPLYAEQPPAFVSNPAAIAPGRGRGRMNEPLPPPAPPPILQDPPREYRDPGRRNLLSAPPPPPNPPPSVFTPGAAIGQRYGGSPGLGGASGSRSPAPYGFSGDRGAGGGHTPEELGLAMRELFTAYATKTSGTVSRPLGGTSGRIALSMQDYFRLAKAAQIHIPEHDLEVVFLTTARRFGGAPEDDRRPALAFELFVELLVETARMRYGDLRDAESTAALFEEHLLPLAHRLRDLDSGAVGAVNPLAFAATS